MSILVLLRSDETKAEAKDLTDAANHIPANYHENSKHSQNQRDQQLEADALERQSCDDLGGPAPAEGNTGNIQPVKR